MSSKLILVIIFIISLVLISYWSDKKRKKKVVFFNDSDIEKGSASKGYIPALQHLLAQNGIHDYELIYGGAIGNKVYDLSVRTETEVLNKPPHIAVFCLGENDLWYNIFKIEDQVYKFYRTIIVNLQAAGSKVILCTAVDIERRCSVSNKASVNQDIYSNVIHILAADLQVPLVDLYKVFQDYEVDGNAGKVMFTTDGVHLNDKGNEMVAGLMWNTIKEIQ